MRYCVQYMLALGVCINIFIMSLRGTKQSLICGSALQFPICPKEIASYLAMTISFML